MFPEPLEKHPDDRDPVDSHDTTSSSERSDYSREPAARSPAATPTAGDDAAMPIIIDNADTAAPSDAQTQRSTPSPTELDITDRTTANYTVPPAENAPDVRPPTLTSSQRINHHHNTWPMVSLMANVVIITAAVTAGIMHAISSPNGGLIQSISLFSSMC
eukprot:4833600-Pleurochrysis_carterae.AAC.1